MFIKINDTLISTMIGDLTKAEQVDAIVNPTNPSMTGHSGLSKAIHKAAGSNLQKACEKLGHCEVGEAKATDAYDLPCKYIIHTVGPTWQDGKQNEKKMLRSCYQNVLETAKGLHINSIGFFSISTGKHGYPVEKAAEIAVKETVNFVRKNPQTFDKIIWILQSEETKKAYDKAIKAQEAIKTVNENVLRASIPVRAINWDDILFYGDAIKSIIQGKKARRVRVLVRYIELSGKINIIMVPGVCLEIGDRLYASKESIEELQTRGVLMCRTILHDDSTGMDLTKELHADYSRFMRQHGYIITHKVVPTDMQRQTILAMMIKHKNIPLEYLIQHMVNTIDNHPNLDAKIIAKIKKNLNYIRELVEEPD